MALSSSQFWREVGRHGGGSWRVFLCWFALKMGPNRRRRVGCVAASRGNRQETGQEKVYCRDEFGMQVKKYALIRSVL